jgi:multicomponent Na+:H+ antiporter subunit D
MLTAAVVATVAGSWRAEAGRVVGVVATAGTIALAGVGLARSLDEGPLRHSVGGWAEPVGIEYVLDPLSGLFAVLIGVIGLLVVLYPPKMGFNAEPQRGVPYHGLVLILLGGLLGVAMAGDLFNLFVFLEIYSIASYALIALGGAKAALASFRYLILATVGSSFYLLGVGFTYFLTGNLGMAITAEALPPLVDSNTLAAAAVLLTVGLAIKMAAFPFHVWLPGAHSQAPPAVAALLAAVQVKVAAYALMRVVFDVLPPGYVSERIDLLTLLMWFSAGGIVVGSVMAVRQHDIKAMLAHSTVAQIGYIGIGIGIGTRTALVGALLHVLAHAMMKGTLFFAAGAIIDRADTKEIGRFAGLGARMPLTMAGFTVAAISMVGLPPTAGFFSKFYLVTGAADGGHWVPAAIIVVSSLLTLAYVLRALETIWFTPGASPTALAAVREAPALALVPIGVLAVGTLVFGVGSFSLVNEVLDPAVTQLIGP